MEWLGYALGIGFWVLCALGIVCLIVSTFIYVDQHRTDKEQTVVNTVYNAVMDELEKQGIAIAESVAENSEIPENNS